MLKKIIGILLAASIFVSSFTIPVMAEEIGPEAREQNVSETQDSALTDDSSEENKEPELPADPPPVETQPEEPNTDEETGETIPDVPDETTDEISADSDVTGEEKKEEETNQNLLNTLVENIVDSGTCGYNGNLPWTLNSDGVLTISGTGEMRAFNLVYTAPWNNVASSIKTVIIENGVIDISMYAFRNCSSLTSITIPDSVTLIDSWAFEHCSSLTNITIPDSVTSIGKYAFNGCSSLTSITIPNSVTSMEYGPFYDCTSLTSITLPDSITSIDGAFNGCTSLTSITIPDSVTSIDGAFYDCSSLTSITIPDGVTSIGNGTFNSCTSLTNVSMPDSITSIEAHAFFGCNSLKSITIPDGTITLGWQSFAECISLANITIYNSIASIEERAFDGCTSLTDIYYSGTEEQWKQIDIPFEYFDNGIAHPCNDPLKTATIHYNSKGPDTPILPVTQNGNVYFFKGYDKENQIISVLAGDNEIPYPISENTDMSFEENINDLLGHYVLIETNTDSLLYVKTIKPVESKLGTLQDFTFAADAELLNTINSITIDGVKYPASSNFFMDESLKNTEILYHVYSGAVVGVEKIKVNTGTLENRLSTSEQGKLMGCTISGKEYYINNTGSFDNIEDLVGKKVYFYTPESDKINLILKIIEYNYISAKNHIIDVDLSDLRKTILEGDLQIILSFDQEVNLDATNQSNGSLQIWEIRDGNTRLIRTITTDFCIIHESDATKLIFPFQNNHVDESKEGLAQNCIPYNSTLGITITSNAVVFKNPLEKFPGVDFKEEDNSKFCVQTKWGLTPDIDVLKFLNQNGTHKLAGFSSEKKGYKLSEPMFKLLKGVSDNGGLKKIQKRMNEDWEGSCEGMSSVVALTAINELNLKKWDTNANNCYDLKFPKESSGVYGTRDLIMYYHLLQYISDYPLDYAAKTDTQNWNNMIQEIISKTKKIQISHTPLMISMALKQEWKLLGCHTCVVYACSEYNGITKLYLYDPNIAMGMSCLEISENGNVKYIGDRIADITALGYFDPHSLKQYNQDNNILTKSFYRSSENSHAVLYFDTTSNGSITNANGEYLTYENGDFSGTMQIHSFRPVGISGPSAAEYRLEVDPSEKFVYTSNSGSTNFTVYQNDCYLEATTENENATITVIPGKSVNLSGNGVIDYKLYASIESESGDLVSIEGQSNDSVSAHYTKNGQIQLIADDISTAKVTIFEDTETTVSKVDVSQDNPVISVNVSVTEVTLSTSSLSLTVGDTSTLKAEIKPSNASNQNVTWTSSDSKIASVDENGVVTAVAKGTATITVTTADGNFTADCEVTVTEKSSGSSNSPSSSTPPSSSKPSYTYSDSDDDDEEEEQETSRISAPTIYHLTAPTAEGGKITISPKNPSAGDTVMLRAMPDSGYKLNTLSVIRANGKAVRLTGNGGNEFTFVMPSSKVDISAGFIQNKDISSENSTSAEKNPSTGAC